jgi:hypothetical protein
LNAFMERYLKRWSLSSSYPSQVLIVSYLLSLSIYLSFSLESVDSLSVATVRSSSFSSSSFQIPLFHL